MRLSLCLLLNILAVYCYETNVGKVCDAVLSEILTFILRSEKTLEKELKKYRASKEAVEANLKVKRCVDKISYRARLQVAGALAQILIQCDLRGQLEKYFPGIPLGNEVIFPA